jgi:hypothetical protein
MAVLGLGTAAGLVLALPVRTGSVACPPAHEGRVNCLLQHAWAPAAIKLFGAILVTWLVADVLLHRLPAWYARWTSGERLVRRATDHGREAVLTDSVLNAATWGIVPERGRELRWHAVKPAANPQAADALAHLLERPRPGDQVAEPTMRIPAPGPPPKEPRPEEIVHGVRALTTAERVARQRLAPGPRIEILDANAQRGGRRLRLAGDPALVVACWSDASSARALPSAVDAEIRI